MIPGSQYCHINNIIERSISNGLFEIERIQVLFTFVLIIFSFFNSSGIISLGDNYLDGDYFSFMPVNHTFLSHSVESPHSVESVRICAFMLRNYIVITQSFHIQIILSGD